jgi:serine/alanine adding enzyme
VFPAKSLYRIYKSTVMQECTLLDPSQDMRWDRFVQSHPHGWIVHSSGWKRVLETSFHHMRAYYPAIIDNGTQEIRSALPIFEVKSWITGNRLVSIPFATLSDPLISNELDLARLLDKIMSLAREIGVARIEIRNFQSSLIRCDARFSHSCFYRHHFLALSADLEQIKTSFHRTNVRQRIQRAISSNLAIKVGESESDVDLFFRLYLKKRKRLGLPPLPYRFFQALWQTFAPSKHIMLLLAEHRREIIAAMLLFKFRDRVSAEFLASDDNYLNLSPNHLLFWEAIKSAHAEGFRVFDFGRTLSSNETLMNFKGRWGTKVTDLYESFYPAETTKTDVPREGKLPYRLAQVTCRHCPDFALPMLGRVCYRHLG